MLEGGDFFSGRYMENDLFLCLMTEESEQWVYSLIYLSIVTSILMDGPLWYLARHLKGKNCRERRRERRGRKKSLFLSLLKGENGPQGGFVWHTNTTEGYVQGMDGTDGYTCVCTLAGLVLSSRSFQVFSVNLSQLQWYYEVAVIQCAWRKNPLCSQMNRVCLFRVMHRNAVASPSQHCQSSLDVSARCKNGARVVLQGWMGRKNHGAAEIFIWHFFSLAFFFLLCGRGLDTRHGRVKGYIKWVFRQCR